MEAPKAFKGDYTGLKFYASLGVCQIHIEIPLEQGAAFVAAFGTPLPKSNIPVSLAIARIDNNAKPERKGGKLAQRAGILCNEGAFWSFIKEHKVYGLQITNCENAEDAAFWLRTHCNISSRADLDHNPEAADKFRELDSAYTAWRVIA